MAAPFFTDAYAGVSAAKRTSPPSPWLMKHSSRLPVTQLLCWILFGVGILWYSRLSMLFAACGVVGSILCAWIFPSLSSLFLNIGFLYNLLALCVALGGQYLRLRWVTFAWMVMTFAGMAAFWWAAYVPALQEGVPLLCLPFNILLIWTVVVFQAVGLSHVVVPLELASAAPERVRLLLQKKANADACWKRMAG